MPVTYYSFTSFSHYKSFSGDLNIGVYDEDNEKWEYPDEEQLISKALAINPIVIFEEIVERSCFDDGRTKNINYEYRMLDSNGCELKELLVKSNSPHFNYVWKLSSIAAVRKIFGGDQSIRFWITAPQGEKINIDFGFGIDALVKAMYYMESASNWYNVEQHDFGLFEETLKLKKVNFSPAT